ncbi:MAG: hypothetical protein ACTTH5_03290 [Wolinella sp.]
MEEREQLLCELDELAQKDGNLSLKNLWLMLAILIGSVALLAPKIYIRSNIYYTSRNISNLQNQADSLREENKHLQKQLEDTKFKFLIMDIGL